MGLTDTLRKGAAKAMAAAGDIKVACVYTHVPETSSAVAYDPTTDAVTLSTQVYNFDAIMTGTRKAEMDWLGISEAASKLVVDYNQLPIESPTDKDYVVINGITWRVIRGRTTPGSIVHSIYIRRT